MSIYRLLQKMGAKTDHHESDLYVMATPATIEATKTERNRSFFKGNDGKRWIEIPFAFDPFWVKVRIS